MGVAFLLFISLFVQMAEAKKFVSEASGICRLGSSYVLVGDEDKKALWWMTSLADTPKQIKIADAHWNDMEDLTAVDATHFFGSTSFSRKKDGKRDPKREQLLLFSIKKSQKIELQQTWDLRSEIVEVIEETLGDDVDMETLKTATPDNGGLNVEGLAYHNGQLYMGLRSPLTRQNEAIVLVIENGAEFVKGGKKPKWGPVLRMNLGTQVGIRALTSYTTGILVLGGSINDTNRGFSLMHLNTQTHDLRHFTLPGFADLVRPEGMTAVDKNNFVLVQDFEEPQDQEMIVILSKSTR